jgi:hypothetical protein
MRAHEILNESKSADIYHGTRLPQAEQIIASNTFIARTPIHSDVLPKEVKGNTKTVSFTRDPKQLYKFTTGDFHSEVGVVLVIDQGLLSRDMGKRLQPYNDMETQWYKDQSARYDRYSTPKTTSARSRNATEVEELVFGNIPNANKYIKKILVYMYDSNDYATKAREDRLAKSPLLNDPRTVIIDGLHYTPRQFRQMYSDDRKNAKINENAGTDVLPPEPGTAPIAPGNVRLYHQTSEENLQKIEKTGLRIEHAKGIEGPRALYASETGFYGKPGTRPTLEFQVPKKYWDDPFVLIDVEVEDIIAAHYPWHSKARYIEDHPKTMQEVLDGKHDDLQGDYKDAIVYIKSRYNK